MHGTGTSSSWPCLRHSPGKIFVDLGVSGWLDDMIGLSQIRLCTDALEQMLSVTDIERIDAFLADRPLAVINRDQITSPPDCRCKSISPPISRLTHSYLTQIHSIEAQKLATQHLRRSSKAWVELFSLSETLDYREIGSQVATSHDEGVRVVWELSGIDVWRKGQGRWCGWGGRVAPPVAIASLRQPSFKGEAAVGTTAYRQYHPLSYESALASLSSCPDILTSVDSVGRTHCAEQLALWDPIHWLLMQFRCSAYHMRFVYLTNWLVHLDHIDW